MGDISLEQVPNTFRPVLGARTCSEGSRRSDNGLRSEPRAREQRAANRGRERPRPNPEQADRSRGPGNPAPNPPRGEEVFANRPLLLLSLLTPTREKDHEDREDLRGF